jgi:hypothetical protein
MKRAREYLVICLATFVGLVLYALAQRSDVPGQPPNRPPGDAGGPPIFGPPGGDGPLPFGPGGFGPGPGGPGGMQQETKLVEKFDQNGNKRLDFAERQAAREYLAQSRSGSGFRGPGGRRGFGGPPGETQTPKPGLKVSPADVTPHADAPAYDPFILRTFFLEFETEDWEKELADFKNTDVEVPAKLTVDGKTYPDVGVHFRGMSSFMMVGEGRKRSLNLSLDFVHEGQQLHGYRTYNLLNAHGDPSFLRTVLYYHIAREYLPAPKANFVRVVINGESWGVYVSMQQFNKDFVKDWYGTTKGARWKVPGSPRGRAGLEYLGDDPAPYRHLYEIKTKDDAASWARLILLCKVLNETPADQLESALEPLLDVEETLKFLALENALINNDGYWTRASDYSLYLDGEGRFHVFPYDANETFSAAGGPGFGGGPGGRGPGFARNRGEGGPGFGRDPGGAPMAAPRGGGFELDPLVAANDASKPLLSKLLAVPSLRARYLGDIREIAVTWLDWKKLGPLAQQYQAVIAEDIEADTRKLDSTEAFLSSLAAETAAAEGSRGGFGAGGKASLRTFAEKRRPYLLRAADPSKVATN